MNETGKHIRTYTRHCHRQHLLHPIRCPKLLAERTLPCANELEEKEKSIEILIICRLVFLLRSFHSLQFIPFKVKKKTEIQSIELN